MFHKGILQSYDELAQVGTIFLTDQNVELHFAVTDLPNPGIAPEIGERVKCFINEQDHAACKATFIVRLDHKNARPEQPQNLIFYSEADDLKAVQEQNTQQVAQEIEQELEQKLEQEQLAPNTARVEHAAFAEDTLVITSVPRDELLDVLDQVKGLCLTDQTVASVTELDTTQDHHSPEQVVDTTCDQMVDVEMSIHPTICTLPMDRADTLVCVDATPPQHDLLQQFAVEQTEQAQLDDVEQLQAQAEQVASVQLIVPELHLSQILPQQDESEPDTAQLMELMPADSDVLKDDELALNAEVKPSQVACGIQDNSQAADELKHLAIQQSAAWVRQQGVAALKENVATQDQLKAKSTPVTISRGVTTSRVATANNHLQRGKNEKRQLSPWIMVWLLGGIVLLAAGFSAFQQFQHYKQDQHAKAKLYLLEQQRVIEQQRKKLGNVSQGHILSERALKALLGSSADSTAN